MKAVWLLAGLLSCLDATAQSARFGSRMISIGDDADRVRDVAGSPEKTEAIDPDNPALSVWTYRRKGRVIDLWIAGGKVVRVDDRKAEASDS
ncbi:hypothetical protein [Tahibacter soli]|uniref:DUF2845 domain-containing protein n=1 Tax=Tahibacter soli TaxID=2983605 RepID=A0A9X3YLN2_9GAMM|nr:hypothetical protein [Tahibacter soli]MDC8013922.1 hypothetical protein [Tahibacter soli]